MKYIVGEKTDDKIYLGVCDGHHVFMQDIDVPPTYTWTWLSNYNFLHELPTRNELDLLIACFQTWNLTTFRDSFSHKYYWTSTSHSYNNSAVYVFDRRYMEIQSMNKNLECGVRRFYRYPMIKKPRVTMKRISMRRMK